MRAARIIIAILGLFVTIPITLYLQYKIMSLVNATDLMWFLFWVNVPVFILIQVIGKIVEKVDD
jgi:hypothetical protein